MPVHPGRTPAAIAKKYNQVAAYKVILQTQGILPIEGDN
jgi:hypothetical protein